VEVPNLGPEEVTGSIVILVKDSVNITMMQ
jgi:hypothetical protein